MSTGIHVCAKVQFVIAVCYLHHLGKIPRFKAGLKPQTVHSITAWVRIQEAFTASYA
jgi:hypothetical protein